MADKKNILIFEDYDKLTDYFVSFWTDYAKVMHDLKGGFDVALSGGKTPQVLYSKLSSITDFDVWSNTNIFLTDERFVPENHKDSNAKMIKESLINYIPIDSKQYVPIKTNFDSADYSARDYSKKLTEHFICDSENLPRFDLVILGVGEDGHIASLFLLDDINNSNDKLVVATRHEHAQSNRVSLTLPVINNAKKVICIVSGKNKADILHRILEKDDLLPASQVNPHSGQMVYLLDRAAASNLSIKDQFTNKREVVAALI